MGNLKYTQLLHSELYPLFVYCVDDYKKQLIDRILTADDKEKVWEYKQAIKSLERFQQHIEIMAGTKEE